MKRTLLTGVACASLLISSISAWAGPKVVSGPGADPACFKPWSAETKYFQWDKKPGPTGSRWSTASSATPGASR